MTNKVTNTFNVYCDESCHLEHDGQVAMVLGAVWCPIQKIQAVSQRLRQIKFQHGLSKSFEVKWTKVSPAKVDFYLDWLTAFFEEDDLHFRALIVPDKSKLHHAAFPDQDHDVWYYKMYFDLLKVILEPNAKYRIYIDIKDTRGTAKVQKLHEVLCNNQYDFSRQIIEWVQQVRSHEVTILQLTDLLIGAISYVNRGLSGNKAKEMLIDMLRKKSRYNLTHTTLLREAKVNLLCWQAREFEQ